MSSVDDRIVNMEFNNKQFESNAAQSMTTLNKLEGSLQKTAKSKGLESFGGSVEAVRSKFSAMQVAGVTAVATIANKATNAGINLVKSLTIDPLLQGFGEYQTNLDSIQTIMTNTGKSTKVVNKYLNDMNKYADQTVYNFSEMARNLGTFTAAGVDLKNAKSAIQGIANVAAASGSSSQQASVAMYQLSQAIAAGRVNLQDWNSVVNAGMGGKLFQNALAQTGVAMGKLSAEAVNVGNKVTIAGKSFRESISGGDSWLNSDILVNTLAVMDGRLSRTQLAVNGLTDSEIELAIAQERRNLETQQGVKYTDEQWESLTKTADAAYQAATQIKTFPQLLGVLQESVGSMFSEVFKQTLGGFSKSKSLWGAVGSVLTDPKDGLFTRMTNGVTSYLKAWRIFGRDTAKGIPSGRQDFLTGLTAGFKSLGAILGTIGEAFRMVFPPSGGPAGKGLYTITHAIANFLRAIQPSAQVLTVIRWTFVGLFTAIKLGLTVIKAVTNLFGAFFGEIFKGFGKAGPGMDSFTSTFVKLMTEFVKFASSAGSIVDAFSSIGSAAGKMVSEGIGIANDFLSGLINGFGGQALGKLKAAVTYLANFIPDQIKSLLGIHSPSTVAQEIGENIVQGLINGIKIAVSGLWGLIKGIGSAFSTLFGNYDALDWAATINAVLTGTLILGLKKFLSTMGEVATGITRPFQDISNAIGKFGDALKKQGNAAIIRSIGISLGILAGAVLVLSLIPKDKLIQGVGAVIALMTVMTASIYALSKIDGDNTIFRISASITTLAAGLSMLAVAIAILAHLDPVGLARGVGAVAAVMAIFVASIVALTKVDPKGTKMMKVAGAVFIFSAAMDVLAAAILAFGLMDMETLGKGFGSVAIGLGIMVGALAAFSKFVKGGGKQLVAGAGAIFIISSALNILAGAILAFGSMDMGTLKQGFGSMAIGLGLLVGALVVLSKFGGGGAMVAAGAGIALIAGAMNALVPVITILGALPWKVVYGGILAMAVALGVLIALGAAAEQFSIGLLALGTTVALFGAAIALAGLGMVNFSKGLAILVGLGAAGIATISAAITAFILLLPNIAIQMAAAFVAFIGAIAAASPKLRKSFGEIFANMIGVVRDAIPEIGYLIEDLISTGLAVINNSVNDFVDAGLNIIGHFLDGIEQNSGDFADSAAKTIVNFLDGLGSDDNIKKIVDKAADIAGQFIRGIGDAVKDITSDFAYAAGEIGTGILEALRDFVKNNGSKWAELGGEIAGAIGKNAVTSLPNFLKGVGKSTGAGGLINKGIGAVGSLLNRSLGQPSSSTPFGFDLDADALSAPAEAFGRSLGDFINQGMTQSIDTMSQKLKKHAKKQLQAALPAIVLAAVNTVSAANAAVARDDTKYLAALNASSSAQGAANAIQAQADAAQSVANKLKKSAPKLAKKAQKAADKKQTRADAAQDKADKAAQAAADVSSYNQAVTAKDADTLAGMAADWAEEANAQYQKNKALQAQANQLKTGTKAQKAAAKKLEIQAQAALDAATALNQKAIEATTAANAAYEAMVEKTRADLLDSIQDLEDQRKAYSDNAKWQEEFDKADASRQAEMLNARAKTAEDEAADKNREADIQLANARRFTAEGDAVAAQAALDAATAAAQEAQSAADSAKQDRDQAKQILDQGSSGGVGGSSGTSLIPSRTALEDAAKIIDRYSASLDQAEQAALAAQGPTQFIQNNYSPEALSDITIYRNTKNLVSAKDLKSGVN